jgi:hypothetical protein
VRSIRGRRLGQSITAVEADVQHQLNRRSLRQTIVVCIFVIGTASIGCGLYSLVQAVDSLTLEMTFKVWLSRAIVEIVIGVIALNIGGRCVEAI